MLSYRCLTLAFAAAVLCGSTSRAQTPARNGKPAGRVDAFGDPLPAGALFRLGTTRLRLDREIQAVAVAADGKRIAALSDSMLGVWELPGGKEVERKSVGFSDAAIDAAMPLVPVLALTPDGHRLLTNVMQQFGLFQVGGAAKQDFGEEALDAVLSADGKTLTLLQVPARVIRRYRLGAVRQLLNEWVFTPEPSRQVAGENYSVQFRLSRDGRLLGTVEANRGGTMIRIHETATGKELRRWTIEVRPPAVPRGSPRPSVRHLEFSADGRFVTAASYDARGNVDALVRVWEVATGKELARWQHTGGLSSGRPALAFGPDGTAIFATETAGVARWDWRSGKRLHLYPDVGGPLAFTDGGKTLIAQGPIGALRFLDVATGKDVCPLPHAGDHVAVAPDGRSVAWSDGGDIVVTDTATGRELRRWPAHERFVGPLAFAPDGKTLASAGTDLRIRLWDMPDGREQKTLIRTGVNRLSFAQDGRHLISSGPGDLCLWDRMTGKRLRYWYGRGDAPVMASDLSMIALPNRSARRLQLKDPLRDKDLHTLTGYRGVLEYGIEYPLTGVESMVSTFAPLFSPDAHWLLMGADQDADGNVGMIQVWDVSAMRRSVALRGHEIMLSNLAFSPDSRLIAAMRSDRRVCLLHAATGKLARLMEARESWLSAPPAFTTDGRMLLTATRSLLPMRQIVQVWEVATGGELARWIGHQDAVRELTVSADGRLLVTTSADHTALGWDLAHLAGADGAVGGDLWNALADLDAKRGRRAIEALLADPGRALALLKKHLQRVPPADAKQLARWIDELDSDDFDQRQQAEQELDRLAERARPALQKALAGKLSLESRRRVELLLKKRYGPTLNAEQVQAIRAVQVLESLRLPETQHLLESLARGASEARLTVEAKAVIERRRK